MGQITDSDVPADFRMKTGYHLLSPLLSRISVAFLVVRQVPYA